MLYTTAMRKSGLLLIAILILTNLFHIHTSLAQSQHKMDSLTYETQRKKVNTLLNDRSRKFGDYDQSLQQKTGIFGIFKTKGDMQRSIDILKQIVITDNNIFIETKKLLDIKDYEKEHYQKLATEYDIQRAAYMKTISKLQQENEKLRQEVAKLENQDHDNDLINYYALLAIVALSALIIWQYIKHRPQKLTKL